MVSQRFGESEEIEESKVVRGGALGNRVLNVRDCEERDDIGARGETMYIARLLSGGIALAMSRPINSLAMFMTRASGNFWSRESFLNLYVSPRNIVDGTLWLV